MTAIKKIIKFDEGADQCISVDNSGAHGDVWLMINNKSVNFVFTASTDTMFEPAEYDDGYLVYDEQWYVTGAEITSLTVASAFVTINGYEYDCSYTLTADDRQRITEIITDAILNTDDDMDLKQARFDDAYAAQG